MRSSRIECLLRESCQDATSRGLTVSPDLSMTAPLAWRPISPLSRKICHHIDCQVSTLQERAWMCQSEASISRQTHLSSCGVYHYRARRRQCVLRVGLRAADVLPHPLPPTSDLYVAMTWAGPCSYPTSLKSVTSMKWECGRITIYRVCTLSVA